MKKVTMKKIASIFLSLIMVLGLAACGGGTKSEGSKKGAESEKASAEQVSGPITVEFWHVRGSGANGTHMDEMIKRFNETNEYGITVVGTYMGSYDDCLSKGFTSIAAGNNPTIMIASSGGIEMLAEEGVLADLSPYMERDEFNAENIIESMRHYMYWDDEVLSMPYMVSTPVFYYNKALWGDAAPATLEELVARAEAITKSQPSVKGLGMTMDVSFIQRPILKSLGSEGLLNDEGTGAGCLDDGNLVTFLTDWSKWIESGFCMMPEITSSGTKMTQEFYQGTLAGMIYSTGSMVNIMNNCETANIDLGVSPMVGYGGYTASLGGGHLVVLESNHSQQEIAAAWEFVKFLLQDEQVAQNAVDTGYLPTTYSSIQTEMIQALWAEKPAFKTAFDQVEYATFNTRSTDTAEWNSQMTTAVSYVIQDMSMTPQEAVEYLKTQERIIFGN